MKFDTITYERPLSQKAGVKEKILNTNVGAHMINSNEELINNIKLYANNPNIANVQAPSTGWNVSLEDDMLFKSIVVMRSAVCQTLHELTEGGNPDIVTAYFPQNSWASIYRKGSKTDMHNHFPSVWSTVYYVKAEGDTAPLCFPDVDVSITPKTGMMLGFPSHMWHYVPEMIYDEERITIAVNWLYIDSTLRDCIYGYGNTYNNKQLQAGMPPNPWLDKFDQGRLTYTARGVLPSLHGGTYDNRFKGVNQ